MNIGYAKHVRSRFVSMAKRFFHHDRGSIVVLFSVSMAVVTAAGGYAVDFALWNAARTNMQTISDSAVLAGSRTLIDQIYRYGEPQSYAVVKAAAAAEGFLNAASADLKIQGLAHTVDVDGEALTVDITMSGTAAAYFMPLFHVSALTITVQSNAIGVPDMPVCMLGLDEQAEPAITFGGDVSVEGAQCAFWSNAVGVPSMKFSGNVVVDAGAFCAVGSVEGGDSLLVSPSPIGGCRKKEDPLADWAGVTVGACDHRNFRAAGSTTIYLQPGVYCGGIAITGSATVFASPGNYIVKDGSFSIKGGAELIGEHVGFYVTGRNAYFDLTGTSNLDVSAPLEGEMAGLAFAQDRLSSMDRTSKISGSTNLTVSGSIYLPTQALMISGAPTSMNPPEFTNIIAATIDISGSKKFIVTGADENTVVPNVSVPINGNIRLTR